VSPEMTAAPSTSVPVATTLTRMEWSALMMEHNLADGHARQGLPSKELLDRLPEIFALAETDRQIDVEQAFERAFYRAAGQHSVPHRTNRPQHHYSSSVSIEIVANHLRIEGMRVGLLHPTFDNIPDILKRHGVPLVPVPEQVFSAPAELECWDDVDAIFLVVPNNPTGFDPRAEDIERIALECRDRGKLLVIDFCFRFFSRHLGSRDLYAFFEDNGVDHIGIEDVGKVWPTLDLKVGSLVVGERRHEALRAISEDIVLNVSSFIYRLLTESAKFGAVEQARATSVANRAALRSALAGGPAELVDGGDVMSVGWVRLPEGWNCNELVEWLHGRGIGVLPGSPFFWNAQEQGHRYIRLALMRPEAEFETAAKVLARALGEYSPAQ